MIQPARDRHGLSVLTDTSVTEVHAQEGRATGITATCKGQTAVLRARVIVLACGALNTPVLLQRSTSAEWPKGIGNNHDLVGRNLMFHASDFVAVWPRQHIPRSGPGRTWSYSRPRRWRKMS